MSDDGLKEITNAYFKDIVDQHKRWFNSPVIAACREQRDREWKALTWYKKAWRISRAKFYRFRIRLGEIIAGQDFE